MKTIVVTGTHVQSNSDNCRYQYEFPRDSGKSFNDKELAVAGVMMYYSWPNIHSSKYSNNTFSYKWIDGSTNTVTLPDGFYDASSLNAYLQSVMVTNGHYLEDDSGNYVYYLEILENSVYYAIEIVCYAVPAALPTNWTNPGAWAFTGAAVTPQFVFSGNFCDVIGFTAGTYPTVTQTTDYSTTSDNTPQITPVSSVLMSCDIVDNVYASPNSIIYAFSPDVSYGSMIKVQPSEFSWIDIQSGAHSSVTIEFLDQAYRRIPIKDKNIVVILAVRDKIKI